MEITEIKGIGPKRAGELADKGIYSVDDLAAADETTVHLVSISLGVSVDVFQGWVTAAKKLLLGDVLEEDEIPFDKNDFVSWVSLADVLEEDEETAVYEHLLTGSKPVK
jgi:predicted RecB family nuclease